MTSPRTATRQCHGTYPAIVRAQTPDRYVVDTGDGRVYDETDAAGALRFVLAELPD